MFSPRSRLEARPMKLPGRDKPVHAWRVFFLGSLLLGFPALASSQATVRVTGTLTDPSGAAVAGAHITARNEQTGQIILAASGADGTFAVDLPVGIYTVVISVPGFSRSTLTHVAVAPA